MTNDEVTPTRPPILVLSTDLLFATKITGTARALDRAARVFAAPSALAGAVTAETELVLLDLSNPGASEAEIGDLRQRLPSSCRLIAFGSHVDSARLAAALAAGCDPVLARSAFSSRLPEILA